MPALLTSDRVELVTYDGRTWVSPDEPSDVPCQAVAQVRPLSGLDYARLMPMEFPEQLAATLAKGLVELNGERAPAKPAEALAWGAANGLYNAIVDVSLGNVPGATSSSTDAPAPDQSSTDASQS